MKSCHHERMGDSAGAHQAGNFGPRHHVDFDMFPRIRLRCRDLERFRDEPCRADVVLDSRIGLYCAKKLRRLALKTCLLQQLPSRSGLRGLPLFNNPSGNLQGHLIDSMTELFNEYDFVLRGQCDDIGPCRHMQHFVLPVEPGSRRSPHNGLNPENSMIRDLPQAECRPDRDFGISDLCGHSWTLPTASKRGMLAAIGEMP